MAIDWKSILNFKNMGMALIGSFLVFQLGSLFISSLFPSVPIFRGGTIILLLLVSIAIVTVFILSINIKELAARQNLIFILIVFGLLGAGFYFLPRYFPQIFAISPEASSVLKQTIGSIVGVGG